MTNTAPGTVYLLRVENRNGLSEPVDSTACMVLVRTAILRVLCEQILQAIVTSPVPLLALLVYEQPEATESGTWRTSLYG
jgi:hypothetical protein